MPVNQFLNPESFSPDTLEFFHLLQKFEVKYVIVGGEAVIFHGYPRLTGDLDFFYLASPENTQKLFNCLKEFWAGNIPAIQAAEEFLEPGVVVQFGTPPHRLDLMNRIDGIEFPEVWEKAIPVGFLGEEYVGVVIQFIDLESLVKNKRASGRPKDIDDIQHLTLEGGNAETGNWKPES